MLWLTLAEGLGTGLRFGLILATRAFIGTPEAGVYLFSMAVGMLLSMLADSGQSQLMIRKLARDRANYALHYGSALLFRVVAGATLLIAVLATSQFLPAVFPNRGVVLMCCLTYASLGIMETTEGVWLASEQAPRAARMRVLSAAVVFGLPLAVLPFGLLSFSQLVACQTVAGLVMALCYWRTVRAQFGRPLLRFQGGVFRQWQASWALGLNQMLTTVFVHSPLLMIRWTLQSSSVAIYGIIQRLEAVIEILMVNFFKVAFPSLSRRFAETSRSFANWRLCWLVALLFVAPAAFWAGSLCFLAGQVAGLFLGEQLPLSTRVIQITAWAMGLSLMKRPFAVWFLANGRERFVCVVSGMAAAVTIAGNVLTLGRWDLLGAAWTWVVAEALSLLFMATAAAWLTRRPRDPAGAVPLSIAEFQRSEAP